MAYKIWVGGTDGDVSKAANYSPAGVPIGGDTLDMGDGAVSMDTALTTLAAVHLAAFVQRKNYTGRIGTDTTPLDIYADVITIGETYGTGSPAGSQWTFLNMSASGAATITIKGTAASSYYTNRLPLQLTGGHANTVMRIDGGKVEIANKAQQAALCSSITVSSAAVDAIVIIGAGATITTVVSAGGVNTLSAAATTVTASGGSLTTTGSGAITTLNASGAAVYPNSSGTITTLAVSANSAVDFTRSAVPRTVSTLNVSAPCRVRYDPSIVTLTAKPAAQTPVSAEFNPV